MAKKLIDNYHLPKNDHKTFVKYFRIFYSLCTIMLKGKNI